MTDLDRRSFCAAAAAAIAGGKLGLLASPSAPKMTTMTDVMPDVETITANETIHPFHYKASDADLADLRRRIKTTRWPDRELVADDSQGVQLSRCRSSRNTGVATTTGERVKRS